MEANVQPPLCPPCRERQPRWARIIYDGASDNEHMARLAADSDAIGRLEVCNNVEIGVVTIQVVLVFLASYNANPPNFSTRKLNRLRQQSAPR